MFFKVLVLVLVSVVCSFAAVDSAAVVNGLQTVGQITNAIATITGHSALGDVIQYCVCAIVPVVAFIFGHIHGKTLGTK